MKKITYVKPAALDLGPLAVIHGDVCSDGSSATYDCITGGIPKSIGCTTGSLVSFVRCQSGGNANSCSAGTFVHT